MKETLRRGDKGEDVIQLQFELNKTGTMLVTDGDFGNGTEKGVIYAQDIAEQPQTGVADQKLLRWLGEQSEPTKLLAREGVSLIAREETGGLSYYEKVTKWPHYPGHESGITIGVGYDLRFKGEEDFLSTWGSLLPENHIKLLRNDIHEKGSKNRAKELKNMGVEVPFKIAWQVFIKKTLPEYYEVTKSIYSSIDELPDLCRSALVSIVFNRGPGLSGSSRREMKNIQNILEMASNPNLSKNDKKRILLEIEEEILSMQRLWSRTSGLIKRRQSEANLWRKGLRNW
jgi:hypothetical protein